MQSQSLTTSYHQMAHAIYEIHIFWKSSPNVLLLSMALHRMEHFPYVVQNIPLTSLGLLSQLSPPPSSFTLLAFSPWQGVKWEREKAMLCASHVQQQIRHWCAISTCLVRNLKDSTIDAYYIMSSYRILLLFRLFNDILPSSPYKSCTLFSIT